MDRAYVEKLLANARSRATVPVELPACGMTLHMYTSLTSDEQLRVATAGGDDEDAAARQAIGILRFVLVSEEGELLLRSFAEASAFMNALDEQDLQVVFEQLFKLAQDARDPGDPEVGKAS